MVQVRESGGRVSVESDTHGRRGLGRPAGGADQPRLGLGLGNLRRRDPGLRPRPDHRRDRPSARARCRTWSTSTAGRPTKSARFGQVKLTIAQFFRAGGSSTQNKGVVPDDQLPGHASTPANSARAPTTTRCRGRGSRRRRTCSTATSRRCWAELDARHDARVAKDKEFQWWVAGRGAVPRRSGEEVDLAQRGRAPCRARQVRRQAQAARRTSARRWASRWTRCRTSRRRRPAGRRTQRRRAGGARGSGEEASRPAAARIRRDPGRCDRPARQGCEAGGAGAAGSAHRRATGSTDRGLPSACAGPSRPARGSAVAARA